MVRKIPRVWMRIAPLPLSLCLGSSLMLAGCSTAQTASRPNLDQVPIPATVAKLQERWQQEKALQVAQAEQPVTPVSIKPEDAELVSTILPVQAEESSQEPAEPPAEPSRPIENPVALEEQKALEAAPEEPQILLPEPENSGEQFTMPLASGWTLADVEALALGSNPGIQSAYAALEKAKAYQYQVGLRANPTLNYSAQEIGQDGQAGQQGIVVSQTFVTGNKLEQNRQVLCQEVNRLQWELETQRVRVKTDVRRTFFAALGARQRVELVLRLEKLVDDAVKSSQSLLEAGEVSQADVLQLEILASELQLLRANTQVELQANARQLSALTGHPESDLTNVVGELQDDGQQLEWESAYRQILQASPQLQAAQFRVERARQLIAREEIQPMPNVQATAGVAHDFATGYEVAQLQIGLPLPIHNDNTGKIAAACADYRKALQEVEALRLSLRNQFAGTFQEYQQSANRVEMLQNTILPKSQKNLELVQIAYQAGELDVLRVFVAQRSYVEISLQVIQAQVQLQQSRALVEGQLLTGSLTTSIDTEMGTELRDEAVGGQQ